MVTTLSVGLIAIKSVIIAHERLRLVVGCSIILPINSLHGFPTNVNAPIVAGHMVLLAARIAIFPS